MEAFARVFDCPNMALAFAHVCFESSNSNKGCCAYLNGLLMTGQVDNTSPGGGPGGKSVPGSHKRCKLGHKVIRYFSRGDQRIREVIPVPDSLWKESSIVCIVSEQKKTKQQQQQKTFKMKVNQFRFFCQENSLNTSLADIFTMDKV